MAEREGVKSQSRSGRLVVKWEGLAANDTGEIATPNDAKPLAGAIQFIGTFGGTVTLQKSNDGTNWVTVGDLDGTNIAVTSAAFHEFSTAAMHLRVLAGAGVSNVDAIMVLRG